ncbi:SDR family oxidoreductase [Cognatiyoonia sp. IB215182]|uniref:SDR family oxidoreductase n=1 Tax=Cognatiyoonia sp. IB215182 TaxID=3097353 RepID=UPI002A170C33|nr:SDR family oxidoreductase [Cognatiyoonia sp. IB215182]MDX8355031.1 SDR family oxidoreductase [Cognatiyoonia sp. IB215182]
MAQLAEKTVVVVGGGSGIGKAVAVAAARDGAQVVLSSRSRDKLEAAAQDIPRAVVSPVDMTDPASVAAWQTTLPAIDHLVISASSAAHGRFQDLSDDALRAMFDAKFFGPYATARAALPKLRDGGSITFFSGVLSRRPGFNCSGLGAVNGAVESLAYALALELGPRLRVNCISPGMIRSDAYAGMPEDARKTMYEATGESLPVGRVGTVEEAAEATLFVMSNTYTTGLVLDIDGGHMIRQYATR